MLLLVDDDDSSRKNDAKMIRPRRCRYYHRRRQQKPRLLWVVLSLEAVATRMMILMLVTVLAMVVSAAGADTPYSSSSRKSNTGRRMVRLDCDPCIDRRQYHLKAILHGTSDHPFWQQVQAAMQQAALDMGVQLELELSASFNSFQMAQEVASAARRSPQQYDALIVTIPDALVQEAVAIAIEEQNTPIFGMNLGYAVGRELGVIGFAAQDEYVAGVAAAHEFLRHFSKNSNSNSNNNTLLTKALFVQNDQDASLEERFRGFRDTLAPVVFPTEDRTNTTIPIQVDRIQVDPNDQFEHVTAFQSVFQNDCEYDFVLLGSVESLDVAVAALESNGCVGQSLLGSFDETPELIAQIVNGQVTFGISQQPYLQAVLPVYFAAIYVTTGKALSLPVDERVYLSGPTIINSDNVPTDTIQECAADAFPVCPNTMAPNGEDRATCQCTDRSKIRIGGVLHGVTTDIFWDPVFALAEQTAVDMGVDLDLIRFDPSSDDQDIFRRMAARIQTLCDGGVDGIFVSIPSDAVIESILRCQELGVPVISVNAGGAKSQELGLLHHIGMLEYSAGYGAAERLLAAGMERGYCLDHAPGNIVTAQRCQGFGDAIVGFGNVDIQYMGRVEVPLDNKAQYQKIVQEAVGDEGSWAGTGILLLGPSQIEPYRDTLVELHPSAIVGSFDLSSELYEGIEDGIFRFGIDQQPFLQGKMPVILLTLEAYTQQSLNNHFVETGPSFVEAAPSNAEVICEANFFEVCPDRPPEDMNYISSGLIVFGYVLFGILVFGSVLAGAWTFYYREAWVVKISQPFYMYLMLVGVFLSSLSIFFLGVETEYRYLQDTASGQLTDVENPNVGKVDAACMLVPWFYGLGFAVTFSAIFAKIQRVKLIYLAGINMQRKKVTVKDVMNIMVVMLGIEFGLLLSWQLVSPYQWERTVTETDEEGFPVESVGVCTSDSGSYFFLGIILFHVICLIFALILAWQTKDINNEFAESSYLFLTVMFMFQVQVLAIPILALVQDSPEVFYFVQTIAIFCQCSTVVVLIFGPKMYRVFTGQADPTGSSVPGRNGNHRMSLSRQLPNGARRTSFLCDGDNPAARRVSSSNFDVDGSVQYTSTHPMSTSILDDTPNPSTVNRQDPDFFAASEQFRSPPLDRNVLKTSSSFQDAMEVWLENSDERRSGESHSGPRRGSQSSSSIGRLNDDSAIQASSTQEEPNHKVEEPKANAASPTTSSTDDPDSSRVKAVSPAMATPDDPDDPDRTIKAAGAVAHLE